MEASRCSMLVALPVNLPRQLGQQRTLFIRVFLKGLGDTWKDHIQKEGLIKQV